MYAKTQTYSSWRNDILSKLDVIPSSIRLLMRLSEGNSITSPEYVKPCKRMRAVCQMIMPPLFVGHTNAVRKISSALSSMVKWCFYKGVMNRVHMSYKIFIGATKRNTWVDYRQLLPPVYLHDFLEEGLKNWKTSIAKPCNLLETEYSARVLCNGTC